MLFLANVLPVGFEVMCVEGSDTIDDEDDETGLSDTAVSFSENSMRGTNEAVLLIFSGI